MKAKIFLFITAAVLLSACSHDGSHEAAPNDRQPVAEVTGAQASFPYPLVKWNNAVYRVTTDESFDVDGELGEIKNHSMDETAQSPDNFSNYYKAGTKIWAITGIDPSEAIAIEYEKGKYVKAESSRVK